MPYKQQATQSVDQPLPLMLAAQVRPYTRYQVEVRGDATVMILSDEAGNRVAVRIPRSVVDNAWDSPWRYVVGVLAGRR